jgi:hypothetical protein
MKKIIIISTIFLTSIITVNAQSYIDALRYSQFVYGGTARSTAMGGAFAALGGDFSGIGINPAGLGVYRKSELTLSTDFNTTKVSSNFLNQGTNDTRYNMNLSNLGAVFTFNSGNDNGWVSTSLAFGYNKLNNYSRNTLIQGNDTTSSIADFFLDKYTGNDNTVHYRIDEQSRLYYDQEIALGAEAIYYDSINGYYNSDIENPIYKTVSSEYSGNSGEYLFAFGANISNKLYFGTSLNITAAHYKETVNYSEEDLVDSSAIDMFNYNRWSLSDARGFTLKVGVIYRPIDAIRLGVSIHSPTFYKIDEEYYDRMNTTYDDGNIYHGYPVDENGIALPTQTTSYSFTSPFRLNTGLGFVIGKVAAISVDYEFVDYTIMKFGKDDYGNSLDDKNTVIKKVMKPVNNLRFGAEGKLGKVFLRGGYAYYGSPYASVEENKNSNTMIYSGGIGFKEENFFFDVTYSHLVNTAYYYMYENESVASTRNITNQGRIMATLGLRF